MRLALTDAPACGYDHVYVTVQKVRVHKSASAGDNEAGWSEVVLNPAQRVDLLSLTNGVLADLGQTPLPAGRYTQMRLVLAANDAGNPMANAIVPSGGSETALTTPSGAQSGLKMNVDIDVAANQLADFVLDFDACKSFVKLGNSGRFLLKPVIRVSPRCDDRHADRRLRGAGARRRDDDGVGAIERQGRQVDAARQHRQVRAVPGRRRHLRPRRHRGGPRDRDDHGRAGHRDRLHDDQPEQRADRSAGIHDAHRRRAAVAAPGDPIDAAVSAIKKYSGGPNVVVADGPVDGTTGAFSYALPASAPVKTVYMPSAGSWSFTADAASPTGKYTLAARAPADSASAVTKTVDIDVSTADSTGTAFTFP